MLYQGIIGGGSSPVEPVDLSPVLLWTNPNPTSAFAAQTVSLNLTEYAGVIVEFINKGEANNIRSRVYAKKSDFGTYPIGAGFVSTNAYARNIVAVSDTGVEFSEAVTTSTNNDFVIPMKIYGVKEYVVEPVSTQMGVYAYGNNASEQYANCVIENCKFKKLKVVSYENIASSESAYPKITINDVANERPAVGTVFDVYGKKVSITSWSGAAEYAKVGIVVEFI